MQTVHSTLLTRLQQSTTDPATERKPCDVYEIYAHDYIPDPVNGFEPADAEETFSAIEITWNGIAYRREVVSRSAIDRHKDQQTNSVSVTFSAISGYLPSWAINNDVEGMWLVIRYVERDITAGSAVLFVGKMGKPGTVNLKQFTISASQDYLDLNAELPLRTFSAQDPEGRSPLDPLYEGIRLVAVQGENRIATVGPAQNIFARLIGQRDTTYTTMQWSSKDGSLFGQPIREVLGRVQIALRPFFWADKGLFVAYLMEACAGPIAAIENIKTRTAGFSDPFNLPGNIPAVVHLGDAGGTGTNLGNTNQFQESGKFSHLAYIEGASTGTPLDVEDAPPEVTAIVKGRRIPTPDGSGVFPSITVEATLEWSDNPVYLARWLFIACGTSENFMEDPINYLTGLWCDEPLLDEANSERVFIPSGDFPQAGAGIIRYLSTGRINSRFVRFNNGETDLDPTLYEPVYEPFPIDTIPGSFSIQRFFRKRYTFNAPIVERVKAVDFLHKVLYPSFRGYNIINSKGKIEIRSEKASDNCLLRSGSIVTATSLLVDDVVPWKTNELLRGWVNIGVGLTTSENRKISSATYTADGNGITLAAGVTGAVTATPSGANLSGGSTTVQASGTVTIGGAPVSGNSVTVTINGIAIVYVLDGYDTTVTVAAMLAYAINADTRLKRFIKATSSGAVLTVQAKWGILNLSSALAKVHTGPRANPTTAPTLGQSAGSMTAGVYQVAYAYVTAIGKTTISPIASIALLADEKIDITSLGALPAGVLSVNWYVSDPNTDKLIFYSNNNGSGFSITQLPSLDNPGVPPYNSTGEECVRIALPFATNTQGATILAQSGLTRGNADTFNWPLGSEQSSVNQIKGNFRNASDDFALTPFLVKDPEHYARVGKWKPLEVDYSGVDNWHQAFRLANAALSKNREGDWYISLSTGMGEALLLEEGDLITGCDASGEIINQVTRIESLSIAANHEVTIRKARKYSTLMFSDDVRQHDIPIVSTLHYVQTVDTQFIPMDLPYWRDSDPIDEPGFHVAFCRSLDVGDYRGTRIYSDASGTYVPLTEKLEQSIPLGAATTVLTATTNVYTIDSVSTVRVQIAAPGTDNPTYQLLSTTEEKMLAGANKFALGINGRWEIGRFQTATLVGGTTDTYDLTILLRGTHGTEENTSNHEDDDLFVLLTDSDGNDLGVQFVPIDFRLLNADINLKAVTTNQDVADATATPFTWTGKILQPLETINHKGTFDSDNDLLIEFEGRARIGGGFRSYQAGAMSEEEEVYKVRILDGSGNPVEREPLLVTIGMPQAAALNTYASGSSKFDSIDQHSLSVTGADISINARAIQEILQTGNWIEATLSASGEGTAFLQLIDGVSLESRYLIFVIDAITTGIFVQIGSGSYIEVDSYSGEEVRLRISLSGTEVRFYKDYNGGSTPTLYTSAVPPSFPLIPACSAATGSSGGGGGAAHVEKMMVTTRPYPKTIYSADQASEDGLIPGDPVQMDIWQESLTAGPGVVTRITLPE